LEGFLEAVGGLHGGWWMVGCSSKRWKGKDESLVDHYIIALPRRQDARCPSLPKCGAIGGMKTVMDSCLCHK
jgi:hypothetical protein